MKSYISISSLDSALLKHDTPDGPLFIVKRHGRIKKCFSRNTAIRYLAFFMTTNAFSRSGFKQRHPDVQRIHPVNPELNCWERGGTTAEYYNAHQRCIRRLRLILARKREMDKWRAKYDAWVAQRDVLMQQKPY